VSFSIYRSDKMLSIMLVLCISMVGANNISDNIGMWPMCCFVAFRPVIVIYCQWFRLNVMLVISLLVLFVKFVY